MLPAEWFTSDDPPAMLDAVAGTASGRQLRLFLAACCRRHPDLFPDPRSAAAIDLAERYADGLGSAPERAAVQEAALEAHAEHVADAESDDYLLAPAVLLAPELGVDPAEVYARWVAEAAARDAEYPGLLGELRADQADLLRDILGDPARPLAVDPRWLTPTVLALADAIYQENAFDRLPVLADALEEAGCDDPGILNHCRYGGTHVLGCHVIDAILRRG